MGIICIRLGHSHIHEHLIADLLHCQLTKDMLTGYKKPNQAP